MQKYILILIAIFISDSAFSQYSYFGTKGKIFFDKITFTKARMRSMQQQMNQNSQGRSGGMFGPNLDEMPESNTQKYILDFDDKSTLMYLDPDVEANNNSGRFGGVMMGSVGYVQSVPMGAAVRGQRQGGNQGNRAGAAGGERRASRPNNNTKIIYQDLKNGKSEVQIQIDDKYILADTLQNITWRFTDEYRNIAGFDCRRVNGSTPDSLYLVAFYTDELPVTGGPALSHGLPGMILGLAIPEMHIQYWATKIEYNNEVINNEWRDKKAQSLSLDEFTKSLGRFFQRGRDTNSSKRAIQENLIY